MAVTGRHGGHRCRSFGPGGRGEWGGFAFGFPPGGGPRGRGRKARRGDIRTAALLLLAEEPRNGYQIMQEVQERSGDVWRPSPGSVYPALAQLEDEGLIRSEEHDGRKLFALTDEGRAFVEQRDSERPAPWEQMSGDVGSEYHELGQADARGRRPRSRRSCERAAPTSWPRRARCSPAPAASSTAYSPTARAGTRALRLTRRTDW